MNIQGTIKVINDTQEISDSFKKREFVVTTPGDYPQDLLIQVTQDKCDVLNKFKVGEQVDVSINLRGRKWTNKEGVDKYFNSIEAWKIDYAGEHADAIMSKEHGDMVGTISVDPNTGEVNDSDLPF